MPRIFLVPTFVMAILATLVSACEGDSQRDTGPSPTATLPAATATPTPQPTPSPTPGGGKPDRTPAAQSREPRTVAQPLDESTLARRRLVVYSDEVGADSTGSRSYPKLDVVTYDLDNQRIVALTRVGSAGDYVYGVQLAGRSLVIHYENRLAVSSLDGSGGRVIFAAPANGIIESTDVSPDGSLAAVAVEATDLANPSLSFLAFVDIASGREISRIPYDTFAAARLPGTPGVLAWWGDNSAVEVRGILHRGGGPLPTGTAYRDGRVVVYKEWLMATDQTGSLAAYSLGDRASGCDGMGGTTPGFRVVSLPSRQEKFVFQAEGTVVTSLSFSPSGDELLFATNPLHIRDGQPCYKWEESTWNLRTGDGKTAPAASVEAVTRRWEGSQFVEGRCGGAPAEPSLPGSLIVTCGPLIERPLATLIIGGKTVDTVREARIVGFLNPSR